MICQSNYRKAKGFTAPKFQIGVIILKVWIFGKMAIIYKLYPLRKIRIYFTDNHYIDR